MINRLIRFLFYLLIFVTPFVMASFTSELFEFNKMMFIYFLTTLILSVWIFKMIAAKKIIIKKTFLDIPILLFLGTQILSTIFSIDRHTSFFGYYGRFNGGLLSIISYIVLYYAFVSNLPAGRQVLEKILSLSLISSFIVILWGLPGKFGYDFSCLLFTGNFTNSCWTDQFRPAERMFSTLGQPNWLGAYLAIHFFIALYFFVKEVFKSNQNSLTNIFFGFYLLLNFVAILFTRSRSALFAVISGLVLFGFYCYFKLKKHMTRVVTIKLAILIFVLFMGILVFKTGIQKIDKFISFPIYFKAIESTYEVVRGLQQKSKNAQNSEKSLNSGVTESGDIRKIVWEGAVDLGLRYPIFGTGVETFAYSYYYTRPQKHNLTSEWDFLYNKAHNEYLNYFATTGFVGLGSYILMIGGVIYVMLNSFQHLRSKNQIPKPIRQAQGKQVRDDKEQYQITNYQLPMIFLLLSYLTILITNFFGFSTTTVNLFFYLIPAFAAVLNSNDEKDGEISFHAFNKIQWVKIGGLCLILVAALIYLIRYYLADVKYAQGDNLAKIGEHQKAVPFYNEALNLRNDHVYQDKLSYALANVAFLASYQKEVDLSNRMMNLSAMLNQSSLQSSPYNVLYWKTKAKNYYLYYQITLKKKDLDAGIEALKQAEKLSPTDPKIPYSLAIFYSLLEEENLSNEEKQNFQVESMGEIDKAIDLKPDYRDGYFLKGQLLKKAGKFDEAKEVFDLILRNLNSQDAEVKRELETL